MLCYNFYMNIKTVLYITFILNSLMMFAQTQNSQQPDEIFGIFADCQYKNHITVGTREYKKSKGKLLEYKNIMNEKMPAGIINLGDFIDAGAESIDDLMLTYHSFKMPVYSVIGNHDFEAYKKNPQRIYQAMMIPKPYYTIEKDKWKLIFLDGNIMSLYAWKKGSKEYRQSKKYKKLIAKDSPEWNGGLGKKQLDWLENELKDANENNKKALLFCHFPIAPEGIHNLWDSKKVLQLMNKYKCAKAWVNGHNHAGHYEEDNGKLYLTLKGMVEAGGNSFGLLKLYQNKIILEGYGRQDSFEFTF